MSFLLVVGLRMLSLILLCLQDRGLLPSALQSWTKQQSTISSVLLSRQSLQQYPKYQQPWPIEFMKNLYESAGIYQ